MRAMVIDEQGPSSVFHEADLPTPGLRAGHVLLRVRASSVNPVDYKIRAGMPIAPAFPAVLHGDVAGEVVAVGDGVGDFAVGDVVYGCAGGLTGTQGALAEFMLADARLLAAAPAGVSLEQVAALPLVGITAWEALMDRARVGPGDHVLVHAGCGGVGHIGVQLAKAAGARVATTVSSPEKASLAKSLGADGVILYRETPVEDYVGEFTGGRGFDCVFDTVGGENLAASFAAARRGGRVVSISTRGSHDLTVMHAKALSLHVVFMLIPLLYAEGRAQHGDILRNLAGLVVAGRLRPVVDENVFDFTAVAQAHDYLQSGKAMGKVVLRGFP